MAQVISFFTAVSGKKSARIFNTGLFSGYDPQKEAVRFVAQSMENKNPHIVVLLGAGLGYTVEALRAQFPAVKIICVFYHSDLYEQSENRGEESWAPHCSEPLAAFLNRTVSEDDLEGLEYLEWPACAQAFSEISKHANEVLVQVVRENAGNLITTVKSGPRWIRNTIYNFIKLDNPYVAVNTGKKNTVVIAASGPSLEASLPMISSFRNQIHLWALPSSLAFFRSNGITPDCVICTDGNYWAQTLFFFGHEPVPVIAMPLSASTGIARNATNTVIFTQETFFEKALFSLANVNPVRIPSHGTVAGSALLLALHSGFQSIVFTGLDFCYSGIKSHVLPHPFYSMIFHASKRTAPFLHQSYDRALLHAPEVRGGKETIRTSAPLRAYAGSFAHLPIQADTAVFRLNPSLINTPGLPEISRDEFAGLIRKGNSKPAGPDFFCSSKYPEESERLRVVNRLMEGWKKILEAGKKQLHDTNSVSWIRESGQLSELLTYLAGQKYLEAKKKERQGDNRQSIENAGDSMDIAANFVHSIHMKTGEKKQDA
ncbi:MAG: DUF115 domain-containing protein [Spirochaetales bacterium]|nr:DUF115 domain-containing protein [Spirochaetales bacterium]